MATEKRYYWMKFRESFMTSDTIDFFMSQPNGANYVVLYQMLCLKTINTKGRLSRTIGEIIIPYDVEKIQRDCKWFSIDTVRVALELYRKVGLIYEDVDGTLVLSDHKNLVGSETNAAARMRSSRESKAALPEGITKGEQCANIVTPDIENRVRDKRLDIRSSDLDSEREEKDVCGASAPSPAKNPKKKYGEYGWVQLTDDEYRRLLHDLGEEELKRCIQYIDESAQSTGNKNRWKDWNLVIRKCHRGKWGIKQNDQVSQTSGVDRILGMIESGAFD